jgi:restriction system protein
MSRRNRRSHHRSPEIELLLVAVFLASAFRTYEAFIVPILCGYALAAGAAGLIYYSYRMWPQARQQARLALLTEVDIMDGLEFEEYVANLLRRHGYQNVSLTERYDFGVDIIAERNGERWGIQTKRYAGRVGEYCVKQVVTGLRLYRCTRAMVITNSTYTSRARKLGKGNGCVLVDRVELARLINDAASTGKRRYFPRWRQGILGRTRAAGPSPG